jgi:5-deoxy-glucuronate isomerase
MADLLVRPGSAGHDGAVLSITPESAGWTYVGFEVYRLRAGEARSVHRADREHCLVVLGGTVDVVAGSESWRRVGGRADPFDGLPHAVYAPAGVPLEIAAEQGAEVAIASAPGANHDRRAPYLVSPDAIEVEVRGHGPFERRIHPILMDDRPAESLLVVEVITPAGHWSSFPPHKHDRDDPPTETLLEETYYHRIKPAHGFGLQRVYSDDGSLDESIGFADGDVVLVPRGYHTVSAPPGYDLYYLNVMAGPVRSWAMVDDPAHAWLKSADTWDP